MANNNKKDDDEYLIVVDDMEYHGYIEGFSTSEKINSDELKLYTNILPKHYNDIEDRNEIIFKRSGNPNNNFFYRGTILKKIEPSTFIMKNSRYYKIWPLNHNGWDIWAKSYEKTRELETQKNNLWELYQAGKVFINEDLI